MKQISFLFLVCLLAAGFSGCKENERQYFETDYSALNIWMGTSEYPADNVTYNFAVHEDMDAVVFYARVTGLATDYDRSFTLEPVAGHIDKVHYYTQKEYVIPAGEYEAVFQLWFGKPDNYSEFRYGDGYIVFRIVSDHFEDGANGMDRLYFILQNGVTKPYNWDSDDSPFHPSGLSYYFGSYSDVKYEFMISTLGIADIRPLQLAFNIEDYPESNVYTHVQVNFFVTRCRSALAVFNNDPDNIASGAAPLTDEYGFPVSF